MSRAVLIRKTYLCVLKLKQFLSYIKLTRNGVTVYGLCHLQNHSWKSEIMLVAMVLNHARYSAKTEHCTVILHLYVHISNCSA